jgi:hypothetical protein
MSETTPTPGVITRLKQRLIPAQSPLSNKIINGVSVLIAAGVLQACGDDGAQGPQGIMGAPGEPGTSYPAQNDSGADGKAGTGGSGGYLNIDGGNAGSGGSINTDSGTAGTGGAAGQNGIDAGTAGSGGTGGSSQPTNKWQHFKVKSAPIDDSGQLATVTKQLEQCAENPPCNQEMIAQTHPNFVFLNPYDLNDPNYTSPLKNEYSLSTDGDHFEAYNAGVNIHRRVSPDYCGPTYRVSTSTGENGNFVADYTPLNDVEHTTFWSDPNFNMTFNNGDCRPGLWAASTRQGGVRFNPAP